MVGDTVVGTVTSGGWGHRVQKNIAYAYVDAEYSEIETKLHVDVIGELVPATVVAAQLYDPDMCLVRS